MPFGRGTSPMTKAASALIVGLKGTVIAVDRSTGETLWSTHLKGSSFVTVTVEDGAIFAGTGGRLYRLDPANGEIRWSNDLPGLGYGIVCIAGASSAALSAEQKKREDASHASAGA
jgi:outer membrane protein assembly factor BamB